MGGCAPAVLSTSKEEVAQFPLAEVERIGAEFETALKSGAYRGSSTSPGGTTSRTT